MLTFTPDGKYLLVANEGEPSDDYQIDPEGSVSVIDVTDPDNLQVRTADFTASNSQRAQLVADGVRVFGPGASVAQDMEPETNLAIAGDLGIEDITVIPADQSPNGDVLLLTGNEISGTTAVYRVVLQYAE
ncbi:MAG: hypothetical protein LPK06_04695 [Marinobacter sp.]|nr:hypothetical protein [Marinobacter sp.]